MKHFQLFAAFALTLVATPGRAQTATDSLRRSARSAEQSYERTARWLAPHAFGARGGPCDETVGRFCLTFDSLVKPPRQPERAEVSRAREKAVSALRALLAASPGDRPAAAALVRLLVEARRPQQAAAVADSFDAASADRLWADWLTGFALHAAARDSSAEVRFRHALTLVSGPDREQLTSLEWLVARREWTRVRRAQAGVRALFDERFWRLADPMWLTPANEVWVEHMARQVHARLLSAVPLVTGMLRWDRDLDQLTVRYGAPIARERDSGPGADAWSFIEHFDTAALAYAPESLEPEQFGPPVPGEPWALKSPSARSSHAPPAIATAEPLEHQLTRIPAGDSMRVRLDALTSADATRGGEAGLIAWSWQSGSETRQVVRVDTATALTLELRVPRDTMVYSAEVFDPAGRMLWRARYLLAPLPRSPLQLSDILLTEPLPDTVGVTPGAPALRSLLLLRDRQFGIEVAVSGTVASEPMDVEVSFASAGSSSLLARAGSWLGRRLGLDVDRVPPKVRWQAMAQEDGAVRVNLRSPARPGLYHVRVVVSTAGARASSERLVRVVSESGAGS